MKRWILWMGAMLAFAPLATASDGDKARDRILSADAVIEEALNVPEGVPKALLDKARCVIVMPSVLKAAFVVGASYGRGTMVCRTGKDFSGRPLGRAGDVRPGRRQYRIPDWRPGH